MFRRFASKRLIAALSVVGVLAVAGAAFAFFTASGSGTGSATVGSATSFVVTDTSVPVTLYPGTGSFPVTGTIMNQDASNEGLGSATVTVNAPTDTGSVAPGDPNHVCSAADYALTAAAGSGWTVAGNGDSASYAYSAGNEIDHGVTDQFPTGLSISMVDQNYNQDNCEGATVNWTDGASS
jgi:hypothetical protein